MHLLQPLLYEQTGDSSVAQWLIYRLREQALRGLRLLRRHREIYTSTFTTPLHAFFVVHICDALIRFEASPDEAIDPASTTSAVVTFCLTVLTEMRGHFSVAGPLTAMFGRSLNEVGVQLSNEQEHLLAMSKGLRLEDRLGACTRETYRQPVEQLLSNVEPGLAGKVVYDWKARHSSEGTFSFTGLGCGRDPKGKARADPLEQAVPASKEANDRGQEEHGDSSKGHGKPVKGKKIAIDSILNP